MTNFIQRSFVDRPLFANVRMTVVYDSVQVLSVLNEHLDPYFHRMLNERILSGRVLKDLHSTASLE